MSDRDDRMALPPLEGGASRDEGATAGITESAESGLGAASLEPDWSARASGGWREFQLARARFLATLAAQSALVRLKRGPLGRRSPEEGDP